MQQRSAAQELAVEYRSPSALQINPRNARTHSKRQVRQIAASIEAFGFLNPVLVDEHGTVLAGHGRLAAAKLLGLAQVLNLCAATLTEAQKRAYVLADNNLAEKAGWDRAMLAAELGELAVLLPPLDIDLGLTGFEPPEIDLVLHDLDAPHPDPDDQVPAPPRTAVSRRGDLWLCGRQRLLCGDARSAIDVDRLVAGRRMRLTFTDPPYNVPVAGHVQGRGKHRHPEFAFASGEMSEAEFTAFLVACLRNVVRISLDGAIIYVCMDWRHMTELSMAGRAAGLRLMNVVVWNKTSPGQGSFYRSQHELIFAFKVGDGEPVNTFGLGRTGRTRSNVWTYPGANGFHAGRADELAMHPTVKPVALVADALRDCSLKGDTVLDLFGGSGTTLLAAEKLGRVAHLIEYEPAYVDVAIRRWEAYTKLEATLDGDGRSWSEVQSERLASSPGISTGGIVGSTAVPGPANAVAAALESDAEAPGGDGAAWIALCGGEP